MGWLHRRAPHQRDDDGTTPTQHRDAGGRACGRVGLYMYVSCAPLSNRRAPCGVPIRSSRLPPADDSARARMTWSEYAVSFLLLVTRGRSTRACKVRLTRALRRAALSVRYPKSRFYELMTQDYELCFFFFSYPRTHVTHSSTVLRFPGNAVLRASSLTGARVKRSDIRGKEGKETHPWITCCTLQPSI